MEFEDLLAKVGDYGNYQKIFLFVFLIPLSILAPSFTLNHLFFVSVPEHWCNVPELLSSNLTIEEQQYLTRPTDDPSCSVYNINYTNLLLTYSGNWTVPKNTTTKSCENGWNYDRTNYDSTAATQYNLLCENEHYTSFILTMANVGGTILTPIYGLLSDRFGRKNTFFLIVLLTSVTSFGSILVTDFTTFVVLKAIAGGVMPSIFQIPVILLLEIVGPGVRARVNGMVQSFWAVGMCLLPLLAWLTRDWIKLGYISSSFCALFVLYWPLMLESPRRLLSQENYSKAAEILCQIAEKNGKLVDPDDILMDLQKLGERMKKEKEMEKKERAQIWQYPRLRKHFFIVTYVWVAVAVIYYGLQINGANLVGNEFLNFFLLSIAEAPGTWLSWVFMNNIGRRWSSVFGLTLMGVACLLPAIYSGSGVAASFLGKFAASISFMIVYQQSPELYPTTVRGFGIALSSCVASAAIITVPYIAYLSKYGEWIPFIIFACPALTAGFLASFLPETLNENLPQTLADAEKFGANQKFFSLNRTKKMSPQGDHPSPLPTISYIEKESVYTKL